MFKLGLIINPLAGIGGPLALKGSDGDDIVREAVRRGGEQRAQQRALTALQGLTNKSAIHVYCFSADMGETTALAAGFELTVIGSPKNIKTSADDTKHAAQAMKELGMDLIVFAGGDGTARDVFSAIGSEFPVLGIPCGVKMHSGVYAVSPLAVAEIINRLIDGKLVDIGLAEVRDIDEQAFRQGRVQSKFYGELLVPREGRFLQHVKSSGREVEELVIQDIGADIVETMDDDALYLIGPGSTPSGIMQELGLENTLLGVDAVLNGQLLANDLDEQSIISLISNHSGPVYLVVTFIGGQGHIFGRGNQQLSPKVLRLIGIDNLILVASKTKISELEGRPLNVDTNDSELDAKLAGFHRIITAYHDAIMYPVGNIQIDNS